GGTGTDTASYLDHTADVTATLDGIANDGAPLLGEVDNIKSDVENLMGGLGNDTLTGNASANSINGELGDERMNGLGGIDVLDFSDAPNAITVDLTIVNTPQPTGEGNDTLIGTGTPAVNSFENVNGPTTPFSGNVIKGNAGVNVLTGSSAA